jgi:hypothetical protein
VEVCSWPELFGIEVEAAPCDDGFEVCEAGEVGVDERFVEHGPEALGRLQFGRVGRQVDEPDPGRDGEVRLGMPSGIVEHEHDSAVASGAGLAGEGAKQGGEERLGDAVREIPDGLARGRLGEGGDVEPLVAMVAERDRALALGRPDPAQDRLQAEAVLVGREDLDREIGPAGGLLGDGLGKLFLNASCSSGVAACG